ncbi:MAG: hypothetical protein AAF399_02255 [Bacteroidota bacterium]
MMIPLWGCLLPSLLIDPSPSSWLVVGIHVALSYVFAAKCHWSFAITENDLWIINPSFPFRSIQSVLIAEITQLTLKRSYPGWILSPFGLFGVKEFRLQTESFRKKLLFTGLNLDAYDESWTEKTLDDFHHTLVKRGVRVEFGWTSTLPNMRWKFCFWLLILFTQGAVAQTNLAGTYRFFTGIINNSNTLSLNDDSTFSARHIQSGFMGTSYGTWTLRNDTVYLVGRPLVKVRLVEEHDQAFDKTAFDLSIGKSHMDHIDPRSWGDLIYVYGVRDTGKTLLNPLGLAHMKVDLTPYEKLEVYWNGQLLNQIPLPVPSVPLKVFLFVYPHQPQIIAHLRKKFQ